MARAKRSNLTQRQRQQITAMSRRGQSTREIMDKMRARYGNLNLNQVRQFARQIQPQTDLTQILKSANKATTKSLSTILGCPGRTVEMRIVVTYTDRTGAERQFGSFASIPVAAQQGRAYAVIGAAVNEIINQANLNESTKMLFASKQSDPKFDYDIAYARCV